MLSLEGLNSPMCQEFNVRPNIDETPRWPPKQVPDSIVVRTSASHAENPGSKGFLALDYLGGGWFHEKP